MLFYEFWCLLVEQKKERNLNMFEYIKLKQEIHELRAKVNTLEMKLEELKDERIDDLLRALSGSDELEEAHKQIKKLEIKNQALKEVINEKRHKR